MCKVNQIRGIENLFLLCFDAFFSFFMTLTGYWTHTEGFRLSKSQQPTRTEIVGKYLLKIWISLEPESRDGFLEGCVFLMPRLNNQVSRYSTKNLNGHELKKLRIIKFPSKIIIYNYSADLCINK